MTTTTTTMTTPTTTTTTTATSTATPTLLFVRMRKDFRVFIIIIWKYLQLPPPTPIQLDIAYWLQHGPRRSVVEAYRGVGKSILTSVYAVWRLWLDAQLKVLIVSASKERADSFSSFTKKLIITIPFLRHLQPREGQRSSVISYDVGPAVSDQSPSMKSTGIFGQITGSRADLLIADDIETPTNSATQTMRDKLREHVKEFDAVLKPLPTSRIIYLGTPQLPTSLYNVLEERGYTMRIWSAEYTSNVERYNGRLAEICNDPTKDGQPTDPLRFDTQELLERKVSYGQAGYALQFMLDTSLSDANKYPLKVSDLIVMNLNAELAHSKLAWASSGELVHHDVANVALSKDKFYSPMWHSDLMVAYTGAVMAIDPSGRGNDETGYCVAKMLNGNIFIHDIGGFKGGYSTDTLTELARVAAKHKVNEVIIESNFGDGMYTQLITPILIKEHRCSISEVRHNKQKELRIIDTLEPVMGSHRLVIDKGAIQRDYDSSSEVDACMIYQMTRITRDRGALKHDDRLDSLAIAVNYWVETMSIDADQAHQRNKDRLMDEEIRRFTSAYLGGRRRAEPNWIGDFNEKRSPTL